MSEVVNSLNRGKDLCVFLSFNKNIFICVYVTENRLKMGN